MGVWKSAKIILLQKDSFNKREFTLMILFTSILEGFSQEEEVVLDGLMHAPRVLDFNINEFVLMLGFFEFSLDLNSLFNRFDTLILALKLWLVLVCTGPKINL